MTYLASLKLTVLAILWLAGAVAWSFDTGMSPTWSLVGPLALISLNLTAAIATHRTLRCSLPLLVFHLCLIAIVALIAVSRLTYLRATAEVAQGEEFEGAVLMQEVGPLHPGGIESLRFVNLGFEIDYAPGRRRGDTRNAVRWTDGSGLTREAVIGDNKSLVIGGFRFYTSSNKGFAARLRWQPPHAAKAVRGKVHMPPFPVYEAVQVAEWAPPGGERSLTMALLIDEPLIEPDRTTSFRIPEAVRLEVHDGPSVVEFRRGDTRAVAGGTLTFEGLVSWMGYTIHYDPAMPWLLAACLIACVAMGAHFLQRFRARPWNP